MPEPATKESFAGTNAQQINKAVQYIHSYTYADTPEEKERLQKIENILFPDGAKDQNQINDVEIVFNAGKYCRILITNDGDSKKQPNGILGNAERLKKELDISVLNDAEAIDLVKKRIEKRDKMVKFITEKEGLNVPEWVGGDLIVNIHHIGSTSVPDLAAKPIIDIIILNSSVNRLDVVLSI